MVILDERSLIDFSEFGIGIPVKGSRAGGTVEALSRHPELAGREGEWLVRGVPETSTMTRDDLVRVHDPAYVDELLSNEPDRIIHAVYELDRAERYDPSRATRPLRELADRALANCAGTYHACVTALSGGFGFFLGGGMHHGMAHFGHGFCPLNDIVVALRRLRAERRTGLAWVVDVDAHRGDGTAALCLGDPAVLCLSAHMARGWPLDREPLDAQGRLHPSFLPGDVDIPVPEGGGAHYVECLRRGLNLLESLSFGRRPDLAVVVAGSDAWEGDGLESAKPLRLSLEQMLERDLLVYDTLSGLGVPQAWLMAGGYGPDSWRVYAQFLEHVLPERLPLQAPDAGMP